MKKIKNTKYLQKILNLIMKYLTKEFKKPPFNNKEIAFCAFGDWDSTNYFEFELHKNGVIIKPIDKIYYKKIINENNSHKKVAKIISENLINKWVKFIENNPSIKD